MFVRLREDHRWNWPTLPRRNVPQEQFVSLEKVFDDAKKKKKREEGASNEEVYKDTHTIESDQREREFTQPTAAAVAVEEEELVFRV